MGPTHDHDSTVLYVKSYFSVKEGGRMTKGVMGFVKGVGMGLAVGCVAGAVGNTYMHSNKKGIKKNVGKALRNVGDLMDNVTSMF